MISDEEIDHVLMAHVARRWRKVAYVVGMSMMALEPRRKGRNDTYFARRLSSLAERGLIEKTGDIMEMRYTEVRLPGTDDV